MSHRQHEYASLLKFVEYNWKLPTLGTTDRRADALLEMFDFSPGAKKPAIPIAGIHPGINATYFETKVPLDTVPLDYTPEEK